MRRLLSIGGAIAMALSFSAAVPRSAYAITCNDETPYAVFYTDGSGTGSRLAVCYGDSYPSLSPTFDNNISSVVVVGPNNTGKVPCVYDYTSYAGNWAKLVTGQHGFTYLQWPYMGWTSNGGYMDNKISSIAWCPV